MREAGNRYSDFPHRITYLIDPGGVIRRSYDVTAVDAHPAQVLADIHSLKTP